MKTLDGQVDYHISINHDVVVDLPTYSVPESHIKANLVFESTSTTKRRKRKYANKK